MVGNHKVGRKIIDDLNDFGNLRAKIGSAFSLNVQFRFLITAFKKLLQL